MRMHGLPLGLTSPPRHVTDDEAEHLQEHGRWGHAPGTLVLVFVFLAAFAIYYFTNWKLLSFVWKIG